MFKRVGVDWPTEYGPHHFPMNTVQPFQSGKSTPGSLLPALVPWWWLRSFTHLYLDNSTCLGDAAKIK